MFAFIWLHDNSCVISFSQLRCVNCSNPTPKMRLASILERAWSRMAKSRMALPFLRPLLPFIESKTATISSGDVTPRSFDLMTLLERIHDLHYGTLKSFFVELNSLRNLSLQQIRQALTVDDAASESFDDNIIFESQDSKDLLLAFDTIAESAMSFLDKHRNITECLEQDIASSLIGSLSVSFVETLFFNNRQMTYIFVL
jgi:hypothetical protein